MGANECIILMISGQDPPENRKAAMEAGVNVFLGKPVNPSILRGYLEHAKFEN